jgi:PTS system mannose-specific IIA component
MSSNPQQPSPQAGDVKKVSGVIVTHGHLAGELLAAAEMIIGPVSHIAAVSIGWHDDVEAAREEVQRAISRVAQGGGGVLLLTDMFGGTPTNIASMFLEEGSVEVLTGVNLPMVIKLATYTGDDSLGEVARKICDQGRQGIYLASALLAPPGKRGAD